MNNILDMYLKQSRDTASRVIDNEAIVLTPENGMLHTLNSVATHIWKLANGKNKVSDIIEEILEEFDVAPERLKEDTTDFIEDLVHKKMLILSKKPA